MFRRHTGARIFFLGAGTRRFGPRVRKIIRKLLRVTKNADNSIDVFLVDSHFVRGKGRELADWYEKAKSKKRYAFNVLAFPAPKKFPCPDVSGRFLGEIYINPVYIKRKGEDLSRLSIHGFLHLLGYDHVRRSDRIIMESREQELWSHLSSPVSISARKALKRRLPK